MTIYCVDCKWMEMGAIAGKMGTFFLCRNPANISLVTGKMKVIKCEDARESTGFCGHSASYFTLKQDPGPGLPTALDREMDLMEPKTAR